jgi:glutamate N-acetyltransferase/amino-acid N-acetyltransferase
MMPQFLEDGHVTTPGGWRAAAAACGIRRAGRDDLALLVSDTPCAAAALFTQNKVKAAPLLYDQALLARNADGIRAVVVNSGIANACTGVTGADAAARTARTVELALALPADSTFVMSTGVIGMQLPMAKIERGIAEAGERLAADQGPAAAWAIMTTDTRPKYCAVRVTLAHGGVITIGGMAKGSGMIHPNMATMLCFLTTDATVSVPALDAALRQAADESFHCISVDGDTSTNDTMLVLANGHAGQPTINDITSADGRAFLAGLTLVCQRLAQEVVRDGEGITRFVTIKLQGATSDADARRAAMTVARSPLVKTALFGADANWGRVVCALGYSGIELDPDRVVLHFNGLKVFEHGLPLDFDEEQAHQLLDVPEILIEVDLGLGPGSATVWTCDFSYEYVRINAEYRT